ncbi:hypothetical protein EON80_06995 [bacterium]|nr:MAG: hypothetical protein EON80_06995 [bacterium]
MRRWPLLLPLLLITPAVACLNDRDSDSLAQQAQKLPETLRVVTGRFERNPPLFYEMRIRRALGELKGNPRQFDLYDDIAVAYDRLHRDDDALRVIEQKRALLSAYNPRDKANKEDWYRYYANAGTFYAHRWLGAGAKKENIGEMKQGRDFIKRAIQIKPNAHFGREKYQLMIMEWLIATREGRNHRSLSQWIQNADDWDVAEVQGLKNMSAATEGLNGLIVLGAAWESVDVFEALGASLNRADGVTLRQLAILRSSELLGKGKKSFVPAIVNDDALFKAQMEKNLQLNEVGVNDHNQAALADLYPKLRQEANQWAEERDSYLMAGLKRGSHPDIDSNFWAGWKPSEPPSLNVLWWSEERLGYINEPWTAPRKLWSTVVVFVGTMGVLALTARMIWKARKA